MVSIVRYNRFVLISYFSFIFICIELCIYVFCVYMKLIYNIYSLDLFFVCSKKLLKFYIILPG